MQRLPRTLFEQIAINFSSGRSGFPLKEITPWFEQYQAGLPVPNFDGISPRKPDHFVTVLESLTPRNQRHALIDLCRNPPKYPGIPDEEKRKHLLHCILSADGKSPLSVSLDGVSLCGIREQWWVATSRLRVSASSSITAARTLLETTCGTIVEENGEIADTSGDLNRLLRQVRDLLGLTTGKNVPKSVNQMISGLCSIFNGLAALSNDAGDRHGNPGGLRIEDDTLAGIAVHTAGVAALALVQIHYDQL